jgi:hypothetical protein
MVLYDSWSKQGLLLEEIFVVGMCCILSLRYGQTSEVLRSTAPALKG